MSAAELAQRQLDAYNAHDLEAFVACYHPDVAIHTFPGSGEPDLRGHEAMRARYGPLFEQGQIHAELLGRMVLGDRAIDHERVTGLGPGRVVFAIAIYAVRDGLIETVWFLRQS